MNAPELRILRRQTRAFIAADAASIVLNRKAASSTRSDNAGGRLPGTDTALDPQTVRIVPARSRSSSLTYTKPTGEILEAKDSLMIGMPDLDVQVHDWFNWQGRALSVTFIERDRQVETICQLDELGETERSTE